MKHEYESNIWSEKEALRFYKKVIGNNGVAEADFICLAARKKYMSEEERKKSNLGDTCMMGKTILKEYNEAKFLSVLHRLDAQLDWFSDLRGTLIPRSCFAFYMNINHTLVPKAVANLKKELADYDLEIACAVAKGGKTDQASANFKNVENRLKKSFQNPLNQIDRWTDIDMDIEKKISGNDIVECLRNMESGVDVSTAVVIIETRGGYHVLVNKKTVSAINSEISKMVPRNEMKDHVITIPRLVGTLKALCAEKNVEAKEITENQNRMVPVPGTNQGGFKVRIL